MLSQNKFKKQGSNFILLLLVSFVMFLLILFVYLQKIDTRMKNHYNYKKTLIHIDGYNQDFDNVLIRSYRYVNHDRVSHIVDAFDDELKQLKKNSFIKSLGKVVESKLEIIENKYRIKAEWIERFKSINARIINSIYYLYILQKNLDYNAQKHKEVEGVLRDILFKVGQIFIGHEIKDLRLDKDIKRLRQYKDLDKDLQYFYMHIQTLVIDIKALEHIVAQNMLLKLDESIDDVYLLLEKEHIENNAKEDLIGLIFFIFAFVVLLILIYSYLQILRQRKEMYSLAYHDTLTKLPNRLHFETYMEILLKKKSFIPNPFVLLFIDLDRFKVINDTLGHDVGDEILLILAQRLELVLGKSNFIARLGGDEFIAIIEQKRDIEQIEILLEKLIVSIRTPMLIRDYRLNSTASIGVVRYPEDGKSKQTLLKYADSAMYHAKELGKDTYAFYNTQLSIDIERRLELEQELLKALSNQEFSLNFQPQYSLQTGQITGVETLVRWNSKLLGSVSPEEFIAVAEDIGLIIELGYYIFKESCLAYMDWKRQGVTIPLISINISSIQFRQVDAFIQLQKIIKETGMNPNNIEIELTERYIMEYSTEKFTVLDDLRQIGCRISIDDFGTGYSSMSYLKRLSIDTIKIDKSFIIGLPHNKHDIEVSKAIILLSQSLGYEVIAEGIETFEQEEILRSYHCDMGQGYYFSKPLSSEGIVRFYHQQLVSK